MNQTARKTPTYISDAGTNGVRKRLKEFLADYPAWTLSAVAHDMLRIFKRGCSYPALQSYVDGISRSDNPIQLEEKIEAWLNSQKGDPKRPFGYCPVEATKIIRYGCDLAMTKCKIVLLISSPGAGKSEGLREFCLNQTREKVLRVDCYQGETPRGFLRSLCEELGIGPSNQKHISLQCIVRSFSNQPRLLIVDEGDFLREESLNHIRYIWDHTNVGVVLSGTNELYESFQRNRRTAEARSRLLSRIALVIQVPSLSLSEVTRIVTERYGEEITPGLTEQFYEISEGVFRELDNLIERISLLRDDNPSISLSDLLSHAATRMLGK